MRNVGAVALRDLPNRFARPGGNHFAIEGEQQLVGHGVIHQYLAGGPAPLVGPGSSEKNSIAVTKAFGAAWPRPQIEASLMAWASSPKRSGSQSSL